MNTDQLLKVIALIAMGFVVLGSVDNLKQTAKQIGERRVNDLRKDAKEKGCKAWKEQHTRQPTEQTQLKINEYCRPE